MPLACYKLQNPHYDATQYAASCYTKLCKSRYFTQLPTSKNTQFAPIFLLRLGVLWPHKTISNYVYISIYTFSNRSDERKGL